MIMTVRSLESVHQLRYFRLCNVLPIWTIWAISHLLLMSMIHVHLVMVVHVHRIYVPQLALALAHAYAHDVNSSCTPLQRSICIIHFYCSARLSRLYNYSRSSHTSLYFLYCQFVHVHVSMHIIKLYYGEPRNL